MSAREGLCLEGLGLLRGTDWGRSKGQLCPWQADPSKTAGGLGEAVGRRSWVQVCSELSRGQLCTQAVVKASNNQGGLNKAQPRSHWRGLFSITEATGI